MKAKNATFVFLIILTIFIISSTFFAIKLETGIIPDEPEHFIISKQFSTTWAIPPDAPQTYPYGPLVRRPFLYYWINGRAINVLTFLSPSLNDWGVLISLRLLNVFYSTLTVVFCFLFTKEVIKNHWWQLLVVFLLTNSLMFVFLSGGVNYDNLVNLCCFAGIYFLIRIFNNKPFLTNSLGWLICISTGTLVKFTVLPLAMCMGIVWIYYIAKNRSLVFSQNIFHRAQASLWILLFALVLLNFFIYGVNIIEYKTLEPACTQILSQEKCSQHINTVRAQRLYLPEKLTFTDIVRSGYPDPLEWFFDFWIRDMMTKIFGILGHKTFFPDIAITLYRLLLAWIIFIAILYWKKPTFTIGSLLAISISYILVLLQTNYDSELTTGFKHIALQGRYIFPVIGIIYLLLVYFLANAPNNLIRRITIYFTLFLFLWGNWVSPLSVLLIPPAKLPPSSVFFPDDGIPVEQTVGEVAGSTKISQDFVSRCKGTINQVYLVMTVYNKNIPRPVTLEIIDQANNQVIAQETISSGTITDNTWQLFTFSPLSNSLGKTYRITISSPASGTGNAIAVQGSATDMYPDGEALIDGKPIKKDISFHYQCIQPVFADWFKE